MNSEDPDLDQRKIIHLDMDAFFAAVEQRDAPALAKQPVVVGGSPAGRGVVASASYEARVFGIRSAMSCRQAQLLCPAAVFLPPRLPVYRRISKMIFGIMREYSDLIEPVSIDEGYLDVSCNKKGLRYASQVARELRARVYAEVGLTASAGVAPNKFLAKIASDLDKPDGLSVIRPREVDGLLNTLPVRRIPGVGRVTEEKMFKNGIATVGQLRCRSQVELVDLFGKSGIWFFQAARGIDQRPVCANRRRKSIGSEQTFSQDEVDIEKLQVKLDRIADALAARLNVGGYTARTVSIKLTYSDFQKSTRSRTVSEPLAAAGVLKSIGRELLKQTEAGRRPVRLLGLSASRLEAAFELEQEVESQLTLGF